MSVGEHGMTDAFFDAMFASKQMGLCTFDQDGIVLSRQGSAAAWATEPGDRIDAAPIFVGLFDAISEIRSNGRRLSLSGVLLDADESAAVDIDIDWMESESCFTAFAKSATERLRQHQTAAQIIRDNRLLEEKLAEQQAKIVEQTEMMELFVRHVPAAVAMLDSDLRILMSSGRWIQEHGDPVMAMPGGETASPLTWPNVVDQLQLELDGGVPTVRTVKWMQNNKTIWKRLAQAPWRRANRQIGGAILFCEDVTESMRKAESLRARVGDLRKLGDELDQLGHAITNDLRAPMRQMDFFSRFLIDNETSRIDPTSRDYLHQIRACAERIDRMMGALQRYLRLSERDIDPMPFDLGDAITAAATVLKSELNQTGVRISILHSLTVNGDFTLLSRLFERLLDNCVKYAGDGATVLIDCLEDRDGMTIQITDDGPGIPPHLRRRAFDFFERLDAPTSVPGEGMGLAECRKIAELHRGGMALDMDFDGGLRVLISLPGNAPLGTGGRLPAPARV